jgi:hypothetical protein
MARIKVKVLIEFNLYKKRNNKMKYSSGLWLILLTFLVVNCSSENEVDNNDKISGPYLGQSMPGKEAELFAPGIISAGLKERDIAMTPEMDEIYYTSLVGGFTYTTIMYVKQINGEWTSPEIAPFATNLNFKYYEPFITPDGSRLYYVSDMPDSGKEAKDSDIWYVERTVGRWGKPVNLGAPVNSEMDEYFPSVANDGDMYFTRNNPDGTSTIFYSANNDGVYSEPEILGEEINGGRTRFNAFVAPDESYIIVPTYGMEDSYGATDYYITFKDSEGKWQGPFNMGETINSSAREEWSAYVSPDQKVMFFMSNRINEDYDLSLEKSTFSGLFKLNNSPQNGNSDIYWIDAGIIDELYDKYVK